MDENNLADGAYGNRPNTVTGTAANTAASFSGFLQVNASGTGLS